MRWAEVQLQDQIPPRAYFAMWSVDSKIYILGGREDYKSIDDFYEIDFRNYPTRPHVKQLAAPGDKLKRRDATALCVDDDLYNCRAYLIDNYKPLLKVDHGFEYVRKTYWLLHFFEATGMWPIFGYNELRALFELKFD